MTKDVQVVTRVGAILDAILESESSTLQDLSKSTKLAASTTLRLLNSLQKEGFVERDHVTKKYWIGRRFMRFLAGARQRRDIASILHPCVEELSARTGEDVGLVELQGDHAVFIDRVDGIYPLRIIEFIGGPEPLYVGAFRKVLLAFQPKEWIENYIRNVTFVTYTPHTISSRPQLRREIKKIQNQGYATSFEEKFMHSAGVAAPIFDHTGRVAAAIQIAAPITRMSRGNMKKYVKEVCAAAAKGTQILAGRSTLSLRK